MFDACVLIFDSHGEGSVYALTSSNVSITLSSMGFLRPHLQIAMGYNVALVHATCLTHILWLSFAVLILGKRDDGGFQSNVLH